jgi:hypothetical protein
MLTGLHLMGTPPSSTHPNALEQFLSFLRALCRVLKTCLYLTNKNDTAVSCQTLFLHESRLTQDSRSCHKRISTSPGSSG